MNIPNNRDAEMAVVGSMLTDNDCIPEVLDNVSSGDFYNKNLADTFNIIKDNYIKSGNVDIVMINNELKSTKYKHLNIEDVTECMDITATSANVKHHYDIVKEKSTLRQIINDTAIIMQDAKDQSKPLDEILCSYMTSVNNLMVSNDDNSMTLAKDSLTELIDDITDVYENDGETKGLLTGISKLDNITIGLNEGNLVLLAARAKAGKTSMALNIAENVCEQKKTVAFFSLEMTKKELLQRMVATRSKVPQYTIRKGLQTEAEWGKITVASGDIYNYNLYIDDTPAIRPMQVLSKCKQIEMKEKIDLIIIDYVQLMRPDEKCNNLNESIGSIAMTLKEIAKKMKCPVIALSQLNRSCELREDKRPRCSDLRDSGTLEQAADLILFLYRENVYRDVDRGESVLHEGREINKLWRTAELIIGANRHGQTCKSYLDWSGDLMKFSNLDY